MKRIIERAHLLLFVVVATAALLPVRDASAAVVSFGCTDCPLRIPEVGSHGTTLSILDVDAWGTIADLDVYVDVRHTFVGDLDIFVLGPDATEVQLFDNFGLSGNDIRSVTFDDEALVSIGQGVPPFGAGRFRPSPGVLGDFDGLDLHGAWTLRIVDRFPGDTGNLLDWGLNLQTIPEPSSLGLLLVGIGALAWGRLRFRKRSLR